MHELSVFRGMGCLSAPQGAPEPTGYRADGFIELIDPQQAACEVEY